MYKLKEYRGETVLAKLTARMVPPDARYPDCMCELLLTQNHLYVLEANYNGTYEAHFMFNVGQIRSMECVPPGDVKSALRAAAEFILKLFIALLSGIIQVQKSAEDDLPRLVITYNNGMGGWDRLYFKELQFGLKAMRKAFARVRESDYA